MSEPQRALIIQDDDGIAYLLARAFEAAGLHVDAAIDGEEGLQLASAGDYALICVDDNLADMNGLEIMRALRSATYGGAVFFTSSDPDFARIGIENGAHHAVVIPFDPVDVTARARAFTARG